ncbi:BLOC-1-related complex subunit 7 isoform X1 [Marmota marmota marmota]|uniref:BLOC-1-related complex subunit 7 isoform X1 n=1 Tax=Marmota marmota marmota TaxID=9994 RepID=UPI001EAFA189|nr:BLOC-1-related complex subunit 7 isoform X1 [Marmota marmota marmota]
MFTKRMDKLSKTIYSRIYTVMRMNELQLLARTWMDLTSIILYEEATQLLGQAARNMVLQEDAILHSEDSLRKMAIITTHLQYQQEAIQKNVEQSSDLQDQLNHLLK